MVRRRSRKKSREEGKRNSKSSEDGKKKNRKNQEPQEFSYLERYGGLKRVRRKKRHNRRAERWKQIIKMGNLHGKSDLPEAVQKEVLDFDCSAAKIVDKLKNGEFKNIVVMAGAGISVSCGIPDFRTPGTGLYDNLQRFNLPTPESVFEMTFFQTNKGMAFYKLAKEMWPDNFQPSPTHLFVRMLNDKGILQRCFTQNIDTLERAAGIPDDKIVEAHGSFASASCTKCKKPFDQATCKEQIFAGNLPVRCGQPGCGGLVKPDIVFFGEGLPARFQLCSQMDLPKADLLIIMGTSLQVHPFAGLVEQVAPTCPRLLLNMKPVGLRIPDPESDGLRLRQMENFRDAMIEGPCDAAVRAICDILGWREELEKLVEEYKCRVGVCQDPIDVLKEFPTMAPLGLTYNWRLQEQDHADLPEPKEVFFKPEAVQVSEMQALAMQDSHGLALIAFEEYTKLKKGGSFAAMLCLTGDAHEAWEVTNCLSIVPSTAKVPDFNTIKFSEVLMEPMHKEGEDNENVSFHQVALDIPYEDEFENFFIWYVDSTLGKVVHRWGPFQLQPRGPDDDNEDEENLQELLGEEFKEIESEVDEILKSMDKLPSNLQDTE